MARHCGTKRVSLLSDETEENLSHSANCLFSLIDEYEMIDEDILEEDIETNRSLVIFLKKFGNS